MWYQKFDAFALKLDFGRSEEDHYVYYKLIDDRLLIIVLYVDDMLLIGNDRNIIKEVKSQLSSKFDMKDLGPVSFILGIQINRDRTNRRLWLNQRKHVEMILKQFNMHDSKLVSTLIPLGVKLSTKQCPKTSE